MTNPTTLGFRVVGHASGTRRVVDHAAAFAACAGCDPRAELDKQSFLSIFTFQTEFRKWFDAEGSEAGYVGPCGAAWIWWDVDRPDDLEAALRDSRRLAGTILERWREFDDDDLLIFLSGGKGCHVGVPLVWRPKPSPTFNVVARRVCEVVADAAGVKIDSTVYSKTRLFRAPNSRHAKTGLHKRRLSFRELLHLKTAAILEMASSPAPFEVPPGPDQCPRLLDDWMLASHSVERHNATRPPAGSPPSRLQRATLEFIRGEVVEGERELRTFRAAANLAEFGCPADLAHELLTEAALDSGLTPKEVRKAIDGGLARVARQREGGSS